MIKGCVSIYSCGESWIRTRASVEAQTCTDLQTQHAMELPIRMGHKDQWATLGAHKQWRNNCELQLTHERNPTHLPCFLKTNNEIICVQTVTQTLSTAPTSSCCLSSFTWAVSCDKSSLWEASARTLTVVSASWSHFRKVSSSLRDICSAFSSPSRWAWRSLALTVDTRDAWTCTTHATYDYDS